MAFIYFKIFQNIYIKRIKKLAMPDKKYFIVVNSVCMTINFSITAMKEINSFWPHTKIIKLSKTITTSNILLYVHLHI